MKKIMILFILVFNLLFTSNFFIKIQASTLNDISKPLIVLQGQDYNQYLDYPGYSIVESNVNFNKCGIYLVKYENDFNKKVIEKRVYVKSYEELLKEKNFNEQYKQILEDENLSSVQMVKKDKDSYYISLLEKTDNELYNIKLVKITNEWIVYDKTIFSKVRGKIVDFVINNDEVTLLVEQEREGYCQEVYLIMLNKIGDIVNIKRYIGDGVDKAKKLLEDDINYYLIVETNSSNSLDYNFEHSYQSIAIFVYNKKQKINTSFQYITEKNNMEVIDASIVDNQICIMTKMYDASIRLKVFDLYFFSCETLEQTNQTNFTISLTETPLKISVDPCGEIYIVSSDFENNAYVNKLYKLKDNLQQDLMYSYQYPKEAVAHLVDFLVVDSDQIIMLYNLVHQQQNNLYGYVYQIIDHNQIVAQIEDFNTERYVNGFIQSNELLFIDDNGIYVNTINNAIFKELNQEVMITSCKDFVSPILFVNGQKINIDENKSFVEYDINVFGTYLAYYYFTTPDVDVIVFGDVVVLPRINVNQNEIYDNHFDLVFNGDAFLNNYKIMSGYTITTPGKYNLIVEGKDKKTVEVDFYVQEITTQETIKNKDELQITTTDIKNSSEDCIRINNHLQNNYFYQKERGKEIWTLLIPVCAFILLIITIVRKRS